jgi:hypothetical protein
MAFINHKIMALKPFLTKSALFSFVIVLFLAQTAVAQYGGRRSAEFNSWEFGFSGGVSQFRNTIDPNSNALFKRFNYWNTDYNAAIALSVIKNFSPKFSTEFEWLTTKLSGSWNTNNGLPIPPLAIDRGLEYPNPFKTGINQFSLMLVANLNQIIAPKLASDKWYLFAKAGVGATRLKEYSALFVLSSTGSIFKYSLSYGGGLSYRINEKIKIKLGATWYRVGTDRLDGIQTYKPGVIPAGVDPDIYNAKELYMYPYIGMTFGLGQVQSKAHFIQHNNNRFLWFKPAAHKYKRRR